MINILGNTNKIKLFIFTILFLFIVVFVLYLFIGNKDATNYEKESVDVEISDNKNNKKEENNNSAITDIKEDFVIADIIKDPMKYKMESEDVTIFNNKIYAEAIDKRKSEYCFLIDESYTRNLCIKKVAVLSSDKEVCEIIDDENKRNACVDSIYTNEAEANKNMSICEKINSEQMKFVCQNRVIESGIEKSECDKILLIYKERGKGVYSEKELRDMCISKIMYKEFLLDKTMENCEEIPVCDYRAKCLADLANISVNSDNDKDGLTFVEEVCRLTDPNNPDTDNDGYSDGDEVKNNYNPLGDIFTEDIYFTPID